MFMFVLWCCAVSCQLLFFLFVAFAGGGGSFVFVDRCVRHARTLPSWCPKQTRHKKTSASSHQRPS
eukprot:m.17620 g.17620  ORF g.17620 m.17620 type:complete len:66 (-) comp5495_c0_seq1:87-284(-)